MEMSVKSFVKSWNVAKGTRFVVEQDGEDSKLVQKIEANIKTEGETFLKYLELKRKSSETDIWCLANLGFDYLDFKSKEEEEQRVNGLDVVKLLSKEITKVIGLELADNVETMIKNKLDNYVENKVFTKVLTIDNAEPRKLDGIVHEQLENVIKFVAMDEPVMLTGPAGSGKNVICKQVADALGLDFYFSNAITQEYKLTGFVDANGNYQKTQFYEAFTKGGLFLLDEMDASIPEALVVLNCAIANRYFDFPGIGRVEAHKNFRVVACANTFGTGASLEYVGRYQLDAATLDRFAVVEVKYDSNVEKALCGNQDVLDFCIAFRNIALHNDAKIIISYREISRLYKMIDLAKMDIKEAIKTCIIKGVEVDTLRMIYEQMDEKVAYRKQLLEIINEIR